MRLKRVILLFFCIITFPAYAQIIDISSIKEVSVDNVSSGDLIIFDIDNTIIQAKQTLASDQWFRGYWAKLKKEGLSDSEVKDKLIPIYNAAQHITDVEVVEDSTIELIGKLKQEGAMVIGLTARNYELISPTIRHLNSAAVQFSEVPEFAEKVNNDFVFAKSGVIFANGQDKGDCLEAYLRRHKISPSRIIFFDDHLKNVSNLKQFADRNNIVFKGYRYGYLDQKVLSMNLSLGDVQLENMRIISDEEAMA